MATPDTVKKQLDTLLSVLNKAGLQQQNQPLYQVIATLIGVLRNSVTAAEEQISGGGGGGGIANQDYLTHQNNLASLPQSRQLLSGDNIIFDDSVFGERTIDVPLTQAFLTAADESATIPNSRELLAGTGIAFDDTVANERTISATVPDREWSVLTNGDEENPELIFVAGDVIMTHTP